jgi:membrane protease YdiL (CAAX protease family)
LQTYLEQFREVNFAESAEFATILWPGFLAGEVVSILLGWAVLRLIAGPDWTRQVALRRPALAHVALTLLLVPGVVVAGSGLAELARLIHVPQLIDLGKALGCVQYWPWWLGVMIIGAGAGIGEELWCRAFLGRGLVGHYGVVIGVALTSILFGVMHIEPVQVFYAPAMGAILHFVYLTGRSLWLPMLLHTLNNSVAVLATHFQGQLPEPMTTALTADHFPPLVYIGGVALLLGVGVALYQSRARCVPASGADCAQWQPRFPGVAYPPPGSGTEVIHPLPSAGALASAALGVAIFVASCYLAYLP